MQVGATAALALIGRLLHGEGAIGYDASYAALWGAQMAGGDLPDYEGTFAPTPHPLANLVAVPLSLLGNASLDAHVFLTAVAFGALAWCAFLLGARLFSPWIGAGFALVVFSRPALVNLSLQALVDVPFVALVLAAAAVEARDRERPTTVLLLLGLAGLLRPEGWPLAALYLLWTWNRHPQARWRHAALATAAPVLWALSDLAVTDDPLYSLHGTRELADLLDRPQGLTSAFSAAPTYLRQTVETTVAFTGIVGVMAGITWLYRSAITPATVGGLGLLGFLVLGAAGLPVLGRYLLLPAVVLALFCAVACLGWTALERTDPLRRPWRAVGTILAGVVAVSLFGSAREIAGISEFIEGRRAVQAELKAVSDAPPVRRALQHCAGVSVPDGQPLPLLAFWLDRSPTTFVVDRAGDADRLFVGYTRPEVGQLLSLQRGAVRARVDAPPGTRRVYANESWVAEAAC